MRHDARCGPAQPRTRESRDTSQRMMRRAILPALLVLAAGVFGGCSRQRPAVEQPAAAAPKDVIAAAKAAVEQWRQAYEVRAFEGLAQLYARNLDLVVVLEGTALLGWSSIEAALKDRLARASSIHVRLKDVQVASLAPEVASVAATMTREISEGATTVTETGALTLVLRKIDDKWLIVVEHYSYKRGQ